MTGECQTFQTSQGREERFRFIFMITFELWFFLLEKKSQKWRHKKLFLEIIVIQLLCNDERE